MGFVILSPILVLHLLKLIPNWRAKEFVLTWFFKNIKINDFNKMGYKFANEVIPSLVRQEAIITISKYKKSGEEITIVSASAENWVGPWCKTIGLKCIATQLEVIEGKLTGKILGRNCYGEEKVDRLRKEYNIKDYSTIIAYGDSSGDTQMLALAEEKHYKPFRDNK